MLAAWWFQVVDKGRRVTPHRHVGGRYHVGWVGRDFVIRHGYCGRDQDKDRRDHQDQEQQVLGLSHDNLRASDGPNVGLDAGPVSEVRRAKLVMYSPCPTPRRFGGLSDRLRKPPCAGEIQVLPRRSSTQVHNSSKYCPEPRDSLFVPSRNDLRACSALLTNALDDLTE